MSDSLWPHEPQHARPPCPSPVPGVHPNSCPQSQWCHPTISSFVIPFSSHLQSFPASGSFQMNRFFASGGQCTGASASASVLPKNTQDWSPLFSHFSSVIQSCPTLCDPMNHSMPGLPVYHQSPELTQTHVHWVDVWITINCKFLKEMGIPEHLICLLRNLYAGQEATVRNGHGTTDWFK